MKNYTWDIYKGAWNSKALMWQGANKESVDLDNWMVRMGIKENYSDAAQLVSLTEENGRILNQYGFTRGSIITWLPAALTQNLAIERGVYDMEAVRVIKAQNTSVTGMKIHTGTSTTITSPSETGGGQCQTVDGTGPAWSFDTGDTDLNTDDTNDATCTMTATEDGYVSEALTFTNHGFHFLDEFHLSGIEVTIKHKSSNGASDAIYDHEVYLMRNGTKTGANKAQKTLAWASDDYETFTYGGSTDTWEAAFEADDLNDDEYGLHIKTRGVGTAYITYCTIKIYYKVQGYLEAITGTWGANDFKAGDIVRLRKSTNSYNASSIYYPPEYAAFQRTRRLGSMDTIYVGDMPPQYALNDPFGNGNDGTYRVISNSTTEIKFENVIRGIDYTDSADTQVEVWKLTPYEPVVYKLLRGPVVVHHEATCDWASDA